MTPSKLLYECWVYIKKMNRNSSVTQQTLLSSLSQITSCHSMHGTLFYRMLFDDKFDKLKESFRAMDQSFLKVAQRKSLAFHISRVKVLLKYGSPYDSSLQQLLPLLKEPVSRVNLITLCGCLEQCPNLRTASFNALIASIHELVEKELDSTIIMDRVFLLTIIKQMSRSLYRTPERLQVKLMNLTESSLRHFQNKQIIIISNMMMAKTALFWSEYLRREAVPIYQKIATKRYLQHLYGQLTLQDSYLPGKSPSNCTQVEEAISCVQSIMHREPYIEIFPQSLFVNVQKEEATNMWRLRVNYLFYQSKKEFYRLPSEAVRKIVTSLSDIMDKVNDHGLLQKINWLKLYTVIFDISRDPTSISQIKPQFGRVINFIKEKITLQYLQTHSFQEYQFGQLQYLAHMLMYQMVLITNGHEQHTLAITIIQKIIRSRREKYKNKIFETLEETLAYLTRGRKQPFTQASIISKATPNQSQIQKIQRIIPGKYQLGPDCQLFKTVLINPNVQLTYALISKDSKLIWAIDYDQLLLPKGRYLQQGQVFPLSTAWRQALLHRMGCEYAA